MQSTRLAIMTVVVAGMLLLQFGISILFGIGTLVGQEVPPRTRSKLGEMSSFVCVVLFHPPVQRVLALLPCRTSVTPWNGAGKP